MENTNDGILVEVLSTAASFQEGDGLSTVHGSDDANATVVRSRDDGSFRSTSVGLLGEDVAAAASFQEGDGTSTIYDSDDTNAVMVWSRGNGLFKSNSLRLPSEAGSHESRDTLDGSGVEINDPPASTLASFTSSAPPASTESTSSLLGLRLLRSRSSLSTYANDEECKTHTPLSVPPRRGGHSAADTASSPERRRSAPLLGENPGASLSQQTTLLDDVTVDEAVIARNNPAIGTGHPFSSIPESAMSLDEAIVSLTGGLMEVDGAIGVQDERLPRGGSPINVSHLSTMPESAMSLDGAMLSLPAGTHSPSSRPSSATQPSPGKSKLRRREDSLSRTVEMPGGRSWEILLSDVSSPSLTGSPRNFSQPTIFPSDTRNNAICTTVSKLGRPPTGDGDETMAADDSGQGVPESPVGEASALLLMDNTTSDGTLVVGVVSTAGSFEEGDGLSTVYDSDDANAAMLWSRDDGSFRSKSLGLLSEIGGNLYKLRDTSYGSAEFNDPPASAYAVSIASSASDSSIGSMPSLLSFGLLSSRSCPGRVERWEGSPSRPIKRQGGGCSWWVSLSRATASHVARTRTLPALPIWLRAGGVGASLFTDEKESSSHDRPESPAVNDTGVHASDTIEEATVTLDQAVVWPSSDKSKHIVGATTTTDEAQLYGGGQIIGLGGDVILSAGPLALPLEPHRTPSPSRRRSRSPHMTTPPLDDTPPSPEMWSPSAHSSPRRRRRRREGSSSTGSGTGRPRNHLSRSVSPLDTTNNAITTTPPSSPDRLRTGTTVDAKAGLLADDGSREGSRPRSSVGEVSVLRRKDTTGDSDSGLIDGTLSAAGSGSSSIEVGRMSTAVHHGSDYDDNDDTDRVAWLREEAILRAHSLMFLGESGSDTDGPDGFFDTDSDIASSQGTPPASSVNRLSAPLGDVALSNGGVSGISLGDVNSSDVGVREVDLRDADNTATTPHLDTATVLSGSTPASPPAAQQAEQSKEASAEQCTAAEGLSGKSKSSVDVVPLPRLPGSAAKGSQRTEGAAFDVAPQHASAEETYRQQSRNPSAGVEEFKWSGLPKNNTIG
ncbi:unnamed protein product [Laminaria digitata]